LRSIVSSLSILVTRIQVAFCLFSCVAQATEKSQTPPYFWPHDLVPRQKIASYLLSWPEGDNSSEMESAPSGPPLFERDLSEFSRQPASTTLPVPSNPADLMGPALPGQTPAAPTAETATTVPAKAANGGNPEIPPPERLAAELGYKTPEFKRFVEDFASSLTQGAHSAAFRRLCVRDEDTCRLLADFHAQAADAKRERRRARHRLKHFRISEENVAQAQRFDFQVLANSLKVEDDKRLAMLAATSMKENECPRNLSAALAIKAEEHFPDPKARALAKQLFDHARPCLTSDQEFYERLFLRFGLYAYYDGDKTRARDLLEQAKKSTNSTERYRVLYWLGRLAFELEGKTKNNENWNELMVQFPLSYYAIDAAVTVQRDPLEMITQRKVGGLKREAVDDPELNRMIRWLEALYVYKYSSAVAKWASWIVRANEEELDVDVLLYLSSLKIASGMYRSNIQMLFGYFRKNPAALNEEGLKLLYPRPYYSMIEEASRGKIDSFLVLGLVRQESAFDPRAVSRVHAKGLMQIIPQTARRLASGGQRKLLNEKDNTRMGVKYLLQLAEEFDSNVELVLAAYNAGPHKVLEWMRRNPERKTNPLLWNDLIPYMETRDYVVSILRNNYLYARLYGGADAQAQPNIFASALVRKLLSPAK
jgi:soluble lytic murein transglycosylase-like protein